MQRYELGAESPEKFWEIWMDGTTVFTRFGKLGSQGQTKLKKLTVAFGKRVDVSEQGNEDRDVRYVQVAE